MSKNKERKCEGCGCDISHKHPNAKFHNKRCKDKYWNTVNPRGIFSHLATKDCTDRKNFKNYEDNYDPGDSEYWDNKDY